MTRVIRDSDDESDYSSPLKLQECGLQISGSRDREKEAPQHTESTSSTEALYQEIEDVRKALFGSQVSKIQQGSSTSGDSPTTSIPAKRQRIVSSTREAIETRLLECGKAVEVIEAHGELIRPFNNLLDVDDQKTGDSESSFDSTCGQHAKIFDFFNRTQDNKGELQGSFHNQLVFAEASSTVPDNTLDQQHMIDEILAENYPIPAPKVQITSESSSSIPWSTYISSQDRKSQANSQPCDSGRDLAQDMSWKSAETDCDSNSGLKVTSYTPNGSPAQRGFFGQSATNAKSDQTILHYEEGTPDNDIITFQKNHLQSLGNGVPASAPLTPSHDIVEHEKVEDTHPSWAGRSSRNMDGQTFERVVQETDREQEPENIGVLDHTMEVLTSEPKQKRPRSQLDSDEAWIGLPKEQYKPRPSRSRSTRLHTVSIDPSTPSEGATQMKIKRRRMEVPAVTNTSRPLATNIEAMSEMGLTPNRSRETLTKSGESLQNTQDDLLTQSMFDCGATAGAQIFLDKVTESKYSTQGMPLDEIVPSVERVSHDRSSTTHHSKMQQGQASRELMCVEIIRNRHRCLHDQNIDVSGGQTIFVESADVNSQARPNDLVDETVPISNGRKASRKHKRNESSLEEHDQNRQPSEEQQDTSSYLTQSHMTSKNGDESINTKVVPENSHIGNKCGRRMLRKSPTPTKDAAGQVETILKFESSTTSEDKNSPGVTKHLKEIDANLKTFASDPTMSEDMNGNTKCDVTPLEPAKIPLTSSETTQNLSEEPKQNLTSKSSNSQSPISKWKMPHRVGLSRKARVAPLLKVMKM